MRVDRDQLLFGLDIVSKAVARRSTLPILSHVLLDVNKDGLTLAANNLEIVVACDVPAMVEEEEWAITVPYRLLADYVKTLDGEISFTVVMGHRLRLVCGRQRAHMNGMSKDDFPAAPVYEGEMSELSPGTIKNMLVRTLIAASANDYRPVLSGVLLTFKEKEIKAVAADGFRLSVTDGMQDWELGVQAALVPAKALSEVLRISDKVPDDIIKMGLEETRAFFQIGAIRICTQLLEGTFPDAEQIIPKSWDTQIVVPTKELSRALKVLKPFVLDVVSLEIKDDGIHLAPRAFEESSAECEIDAVVDGGRLEDGTRLKIGLGIGYLIDVLKVIQSENVVFEMTKPTRPVLVRPEGVENFVHVIMPASLS